MDPSEAPVHTHVERVLSSESRGLREFSGLPALPYAPLHGRGAHVPTPRPHGSLDVYQALVTEYKSHYKIFIRKWHRHMAGVAYELTFRDGRIKRLISAPRPRSPVSAAIFLHEVGHHAVGFHRYSSRCLEEFYVWQWAFRQMTARGIPIDERVLAHYRRSMQHYARVAQRQGHTIPHEVRSFVSPSVSAVRA